MKKIIVKLLYKFRKFQYSRRGVEIGDNTFVSHKAYIDKHKGAKVIIGKNCFITRNVIILNHTDTYLGGPLELWKNYGFSRIHKDVIIEDNVFIGVQAVIMPGVRIGKNSIIGALSLVTKDVPANSVVGGVPAKRICSLQEMLKKQNDNFDEDKFNLLFS